MNVFLGDRDMNVERELIGLGIRTKTINGAVMDIGEYVKGDVCRKVNEVYNKVLGRGKSYTNELRARLGIKYLVSELYGVGYNVLDIDRLLETVDTKVELFVNDPKWSFIVDYDTESYNTEDVHRADNNLKDVRRADNNRKVRNKVSKQDRSIELLNGYLDGLVEGGKKYVAKEFREILIKELGMTMAGSSTYEYNLRKRDSRIKEYEEKKGVKVSY